MKKKTKQPVHPHQKARFNELAELLGKRRRLTAEQYKEALHEIRANYVTALQMRSAIGSTQDSGALMNIIDKVHWLIDSVESSAPGSNDNEPTVNVQYEMTLPKDEKKK